MEKRVQKWHNEDGTVAKFAKKTVCCITGHFYIMNMFQRHKSKNHAEKYCKYYWIVLTTVVFNTIIGSDSLRYRSHKNHLFFFLNLGTRRKGRNEHVIWH